MAMEKKEKQIKIIPAFITLTFWWKVLNGYFYLFFYCSSLSLAFIVTIFSKTSNARELLGEKYYNKIVKFEPGFQNFFSLSFNRHLCGFYW